MAQSFNRAMQHQDFKLNSTMQIEATTTLCYEKIKSTRAMQQIHYKQDDIGPNSATRIDRKEQGKRRECCFSAAKMGDFDGD